MGEEIERDEEPIVAAAMIDASELPEERAELNDTMTPQEFMGGAAARSNGKDDEGPIDERFTRAIIAVAVLGTALALISGFASSSAWDAGREIGGALVSGAVVAGIVVWYEERVERRRTKREEKRDEKAALAAWTREIDLQMLKVVRHELLRKRFKFLIFVNNRSRSIRETLQESPQTSTGHLGHIGDLSILMTDLANEAKSLALMQNRPDLAAHLNDWLFATAKVPWGKIEGHAEMTKQLDELESSMKTEKLLWEKLEAAFKEYQEERYGSSGLESTSGTSGDSTSP